MYSVCYFLFRGPEVDDDDDGKTEVISNGNDTNHHGGRKPLSQQQVGYVQLALCYLICLELAVRMSFVLLIWRSHIKDVWKIINIYPIRKFVESIFSQPM